MGEGGGGGSNLLHRLWLETDHPCEQSKKRTNGSTLEVRCRAVLRRALRALLPIPERNPGAGWKKKGPWVALSKRIAGPRMNGWWLDTKDQIQSIAFELCCCHHLKASQTRQTRQSYTRKRLSDSLCVVTSKLCCLSLLTHDFILLRLVLDPALPPLVDFSEM